MLTWSGATLDRSSEKRVSTAAPADSFLRESVEASVLLLERLSIWAWLGAVATAIAGCSALFILRGSPPSANWLRPFAMMHIVGSALFTGIGLYLRQLGASRSTPKIIDPALAFTTTLVLLGSSWHVPHEVRPDLIAILALGQLLVMRAAFVPSTPRRTLVINLACTLPIVPVTLAYFSARLHPLADPGPLSYACFSAAFAASIVVIGAIVARTTERLRDRTAESLRFGQYSLVQKIGGGGMGVVYKAEHATLRRPTAIKVLPRDKGEQSLIRFEQEARMTALLCHPNTVSVYDYGRTPGGTFYYAMEYIEGIDLDMLVRHDGPQHPGRVIQIVSQICGSLAEAHAIGLIHRDIKPANVFLCARAGMVDVVKVLDFGLVKQFGEGSSESDGDAASRQKLSGTPHYIAPEVILGGGEVDGRADIYAVGCVAHYLLTGTAPFTGNSVLEVLGQHLHATPRAFAQQSPWPVSPELEQVVLSCLAKSRVHRPSDAATLHALVQRCPEARAWDQHHGRHWWAERGASLQATIEASRDEEETVLAMPAWQSAPGRA